LESGIVPSPMVVKFALAAVAVFENWTKPLSEVVKRVEATVAVLKNPTTPLLKVLNVAWLAVEVSVNVVTPLKTGVDVAIRAVPASAPPWKVTELSTLLMVALPTVAPKKSRLGEVWVPPKRILNVPLPAVAPF
jgi:hypothetical protein